MEKSVAVFLCLFSASVFAQDILAKMDVPGSSEKEHLVSPSQGAVCLLTAQYYSLMSRRTGLYHEHIS